MTSEINSSLGKDTGAFNSLLSLPSGGNHSPPKSIKVQSEHRRHKMEAITSIFSALFLTNLVFHVALFIFWGAIFVEIFPLKSTVFVRILPRSKTNRISVPVRRHLCISPPTYISCTFIPVTKICTRGLVSSVPQAGDPGDSSRSSSLKAIRSQNPSFPREVRLISMTTFITQSVPCFTQSLMT